MAFKMKKTAQKPIMGVYATKRWIKAEVKKPIRPDDLFLAFLVTALLLIASFLYLQYHEKDEEKQRTEQMKQRIKDTRR